LYWIFEPELNPNFPIGFYNPVAIVDHIIYAGCLNGHLYAIDESSGSVIWEFVADDFSEAFGPYPFASTPAVDVDRGMIYIATDGLYAVDLYDGTLVWKTDTGFADAGYAWEFWSSPNFDSDTIYFSSVSNRLLAIEPEDGSIRWAFETGERQYVGGSEVNNWGGGPATSTPAIGPQLVYFTDWDENLYGVDKQTGEMELIQGLESDPSGLGLPMEWGPLDMGGGQGYPSVALDVERNMLFVADTAGNVWGMSMDPDGDAIDNDGDGKAGNEGDVIWQYTTDSDIYSSPTVYEDTVYVGSTDTSLYAFNPDNGQIKWQSQLTGFPLGSQAVADGKIYTSTANYENGWVGYVSAYDIEGGDEAWSLRIDNPFIAGPVPYNDKLIVGDFFGPSHLIAFGAGGPKPDLFVDDLTVSESNDDGERIVYATLGNKPKTVMSPPFDVHIFVDGDLEYNGSFESLAPGDLAAANVKLDMGGGSHEIEVKIIQRPTGWYHIEEVNLANNEESIKVGGVFAAVAGGSAFALPLWFILGLLIGFLLAWFFMGGRDQEDRRYLPHVAEVHETPIGAGRKVKIDWDNIQYITSKKAKRFHMEDCPFAVNIPDKSRILMSQDEADKSDKKPCKCTEIKSAHDISYRHAKDAETGEEIVEAEQGEVLDAEQS